jgi:geranylgeranyl diphosphate synthase type I
MDLSSYIAEFSPRIEEELQREVGLSKGPGLDETYRMLAYHMGWEDENTKPESHGKRIRPLLVLLTAIAAGGEWQDAMPAAIAVELVHNFSLIHDDIQDQSPVRHGRPTVWKKWGVAQAINAGDAMFTLAHLSILRLNETASPAVTLRASRMLQESCLALTQGQYLDLAYEARDNLHLDAYWRMVRGKTAALLSTCGALGALVAGADEEVIEAYRSFAEHLGLAFQVLDDILGIWGDINLTGKSVHSDLVTGKKSLPILFALEQKGEFAKRWQQSPISTSEVPSIVTMLETEGARTYALKRADDLTTFALSALHKANPLKDAGQALEELANQLLNRKM